jgi:MSHA biogenesis protein MshK
MRLRATLAGCFAERTHMGHWLLLAMALGAPSAVWCQGFSDPTRPPAGYSDIEAPGMPMLGGGLVLQSVMISSSMRAAIISGEMVKLGGKIGNATLVKVGENEVVLKDGEDTLTLKMYPGVDKREIAPAPEKPAIRRSRPVKQSSNVAADGADK